jgi:hypothetical protein
VSRLGETSQRLQEEIAGVHSAAAGEIARTSELLQETAAGTREQFDDVVRRLSETAGGLVPAVRDGLETLAGSVAAEWKRQFEGVKGAQEEMARSVQGFRVVLKGATEESSHLLEDWSRKLGDTMHRTGENLARDQELSRERVEATLRRLEALGVSTAEQAAEGVASQKRTLEALEGQVSRIGDRLGQIGEQHVKALGQEGDRLVESVVSEMRISVDGQREVISRLEGTTASVGERLAAMMEKQESAAEDLAERTSRLRQQADGLLDQQVSTVVKAAKELVDSFVREVKTLAVDQEKRASEARAVLSASLKDATERLSDSQRKHALWMKASRTTLQSCLDREAEGAARWQQVAACMERNERVLRAVGKVIRDLNARLGESTNGARTNGSRGWRGLLRRS